MNEPKLPARMGRPPRFPDEGPRTNHSLRLRPSVSQALREAAEKNNRSLSEEMEHRLTFSFDMPDDNSDDHLYRAVVDKLMFDRILNSLISESMFYVNELIRTKDRRYIIKLQVIIDKYRSGVLGRFKKILGNRTSKYLSFEEDMAALEISNAEIKLEEIEDRIKELSENIKDADNRIKKFREDNKQFANMDMDTNLGLDLINAKKIVSKIRF